MRTALRIGPSLIIWLVYSLAVSVGYNTYGQDAGFARVALLGLMAAIVLSAVATHAFTRLFTIRTVQRAQNARIPALSFAIVGDEELTRCRYFVPFAQPYPRDSVESRAFVPAPMRRSRRPDAVGQ
jgi:hypothetical protein